MKHEIYTVYYIDGDKPLVWCVCYTLREARLYVEHLLESGRTLHAWFSRK